MGTTLVTLLIPGGSLIAQTAQKITAELATAERIKSKDTRHAVSSALRSIRSKLSGWTGHHAPENGVAMFASDKELVVLADLPARVKSPLYRCDSRFHVDVIQAMLHDGPTFGFIIFDGSGCLVATLSGNVVKKLGELTAHLPKKHGKGGQSAPRFQHTRLEQRIIFRKKAEAMIRQVLIGADHKPIVKGGIIIAGSSTYKGELELESRLAPLVSAVVTVQYSGMR